MRGQYDGPYRIGIVSRIKMRFGPSSRVSRGIWAVGATMWGLFGAVAFLSAVSFGTGLDRFGGCS